MSDQWLATWASDCQWERGEYRYAPSQMIEVARRVEAALARVAELEADKAKLQAFKDWVHKYLDDHGVPHHPPGSHGAEGCRIGDRMDWLTARVAGLKAETALREESIAELDSTLDDEQAAHQETLVMLQRTQKRVAELEGENARLKNTLRETLTPEEKLTLAQAIEKARGGPAPVPRQGFAEVVQ